ncbi:MAG TPA: NAD(P)-binding protein [Longimicrobiales bacterium]|nr:NAD(P)-binding protein [Longimicrobiales bacterium]
MSEIGPRDLSVSSTTTEMNRTGSWKYIRPVYHDRVAPCNERCPVGIDIEGYMNLLREDRIDEAVDLLLRENPMPAVTGRVCDHPCEQACNRCGLDGAVAIHAVERMLGDRALERPYPAAPLRQREQVGVVGSGPAGLACAYHLARLGYPVTVFEAAREPGGMLRLGIPEYRLPRAVLDLQLDRIRELGVNFVCGVRLGGDLQWNVLSWFDAVFMAPGAHLPRPLGVPGEGHARVRQGLDFLADVNGGQRPDVGGRVLVIGGGNTAMDCARTARRLGGAVSVMYRRTRAEMPAIAEEIQDAEAEGVSLEFLAAPVAFHPLDAGVLDAEFERMVLGEPDASGRRSPVPTGERFRTRADLVLLATGENASIESLPLNVDIERGAIRVDELGTTTVRAFFAGGDAAGHERTVAHALGAGKRAALGIDRYLRQARGERELRDPVQTRVASGNLSMTRWRGDDPVRRVDPVEEVVGPADVNLTHFAPAARHADHKPNGETATTFVEVNLGLSAADALAEAHRCFNCGVCNECELCLIYCADVAIRRTEGGARFEIDLDYCKGCGVCAEECPRGAISMTREGL